jgi:hypothetical protein
LRDPIGRRVDRWPAPPRWMREAERWDILRLDVPPTLLGHADEVIE